MEFKFRSIDTQNKQYSYVFPTSSSPSLSNYTYFSDQPIIDGLYGGRSVIPMMLGQPLRNRHLLEEELPLHGEQSSPYTVTVPLMAFEERYGGRGHDDHHRGIMEFEVAPLRRLPLSPKINEMTTVYQPQELNKEIIVLGNPSSAPVSGSKWKAPPPSSPTAAGPSRICSKKIIEEWRCAVCDISVTSERGLKDHLAGKKHMAKVESLKGNNTGADIGLGVKKLQTSEIKSLKGDNTGGDIGIRIIKNKQTSSENNNVGDIGLGVIKSSVKYQTCDIKKMKSDGGRMRKKFKFWCKMCKTGAYDEVVMRDHKKGKKHMKNRRMMMKARAQKRSSNRKGI